MMERPEEVQPPGLPRSERRRPLWVGTQAHGGCEISSIGSAREGQATKLMERRLDLLGTGLNVFFRVTLRRARANSRRPVPNSAPVPLSPSPLCTSNHMRGWWRGLYGWCRQSSRRPGCCQDHEK